MVHLLLKHTCICLLSVLVVKTFLSSFGKKITNHCHWIGIYERDILDLFVYFALNVCNLIDCTLILLPLPPIIHFAKD